MPAAASRTAHPPARAGPASARLASLTSVRLPAERAQVKGRAYGGPASSADSIEHRLEQLQLALDEERAASAGGGVGSSGNPEEDERELLEREAFLGLCGGFSAYDTCLCVRPFPLLLVATWTIFFRDDYNLPDHLLVVAGSYNLQRFLILDVHSGELLTSPTTAPSLKKRMR